MRIVDHITWFSSDTSNPRTEVIGKQIVKACGGLPLAITLIGQLLSRMSLENWELILQALRLGNEDPWELGSPQFLDLSYETLPFRLKACFLYMGCFPPDQPIIVDKLHLLWMAEGLISSIEEAREYSNELIFRGLLTVVEKEDMLASTKFISGRMHDLIRDLCISRGRHEKLFKVIEFSDAKERRSFPDPYKLVVYLHQFEYANDVVLNIHDAKHIRSILFFDTVEPMPQSTWPSEFVDLTNFKSVRVLDFGGVNFEVKRLPRGIEKLIYLRHLSFQGCYLQKLPSSFGSFAFLETLDLRVIDSCLMTIPNILRKLLRLRHLYFPLAFQCDGKEKLKLDGLKNLQVVENFDAGSCDAKDLLPLENLQILTGTVDGNNLDMDIINTIKKIKSNGQSSLVVKGFDCYSEGRLFILAGLLACSALHALDLEGHIEASPRDIKFGHSFTKMVFDGSEFSEDPMPVLGELPNLKSLVLCNDAFVGLTLVCRKTDFPQLMSLKLANLQDLKNWEMESGAMPKLTILTIEQCENLEMLPTELAEVPTPLNLMIGSMSKAFQQIAVEKYDNWFESITCYDC